MRASILRIAIWLAAAALAGCGTGGSSDPVKKTCKSDSECGAGKVCNPRGFCQLRLGCSSDAECGANRTCDLASGSCLCVNDSGCQSGEFCNANQRCQPFGACTDNADCPPNFVCDTAGKTCLATGTCNSTLQCPFGQVCDTTQHQCLPGCKDSGDCPQTTTDGTGTTVFSPSACIGGVCQQGKCTSNLGCQFGYKCVNNSCVTACNDGPYCASCDPLLGGMDCGGGNNGCLDDPSNAASCSGTPSSSCHYFCGVDCASGQACPSGYACVGVVTITQGLICTCGQTCSNGTGPCQCQEQGTSGFCLCKTDAECGGGSLFGGATCTSAGYCESGKMCAPSKGYSCTTPGAACN